MWEYHLYGDIEHDEFEVIVDTTLQQARRMGAPRAIALCQSFKGALEFQVGHWSEAEEFCRQLDEATTRYGSHTWVALASQARGELATARGDIERASGYYEEARTGLKQAKNEYLAAQIAEVQAQLQA